MRQLEVDITKNNALRIRITSSNEWRVLERLSFVPKHIQCNWHGTKDSKIDMYTIIIDNGIVVYAIDIKDNHIILAKRL